MNLRVVLGRGTRVARVLKSGLRELDAPGDVVAHSIYPSG
jgi:hypothetical protein